MDQQLGDNYWAEGNSQDGFEVQEHSIFKQEIPDAADEENNEDETTELVLSNKGGPKIIHKNFMYTLHKKQPYNIRWRCVRRALACRGSIITGADCKSPRLRMDHNHEADLMAVQCARRRYEAMGQPVILETQAEAEDEQLDGEEAGSLEDTSQCEDQSDSVMQDASLPMPPPSKSMRLSSQSLIRPKLKNIAPATSTQHQPHGSQKSPKTLLLKTMPLKVKQVASSTIKVPSRQSQLPPQPENIVPQQPAEVCLRWNSYHSNMQNSFPSLLDSEQFVDVTLACEGRSLKCHKMILSSCSDYLAELLRDNPCQHPIILMKDLKFWEIEALVRFMYRGEVNVAHEKLPELLTAAEALQIKGLAGPSPSNHSQKPPKLMPHLKPTPRVNSAKDKQSSAYHSPPNPKRAQKRQSDGYSSNPFNKIRLQRPMTPTSPNTSVKLEPLDLPLSPNQLYPADNTENYENLMNLHEDDDPGGEDGELMDRDYDGPHDLNEDQMEFVPTDFLEQEQDIVEEIEANGDRDSNDEGELTIDEENCKDNYEEIKQSNEKKTNPKRDDSQSTRRKEEFAKDREKASGN